MNTKSVNDKLLFYLKMQMNFTDENHNLLLKLFRKQYSQLRWNNFLTADASLSHSMNHK